PSLSSIKNTASKIKDKIKNIEVQNPLRDGLKQGLRNIKDKAIEEIRGSGEIETIKLAKEGLKKAASKETLRNTKEVIKKGIQSIETQGIRQTAKKAAESTAKSALRGISKAAGPIVAVAAAGFDFKSRIDEGKTVKRAAIETAVSTGAGVLGAAAAGAALGSVVPGVGTVVGAIAGGAIAAFGADKLMDKILGNWGRK
ncbi:MAG: hypothetical protein NZM44_02235, partial [Candidatus Calescibacterium sp.]|nr:hypothetical protein [Candidatus Calescibacterium sp.]